MRRDETTEATTDPDEASGDTVTSPRYDDWPIADERHQDARYLGATTEGIPLFHDRRTIFRGRPDEEKREIVPEPDTKRELEAEERLGDVLEEIGETLGWQSLSAFAAEHLSEEDRDPEHRADHPQSERESARESDADRNP